MNFDVEHQVLQTATELYELALTETETLNQYEDTVEQLSQDVLERHPDFPVNLLVFAMGRALGRIEGRRSIPAVNRRKP
jgi:hypothetical protein